MNLCSSPNKNAAPAFQAVSRISKHMAGFKKDRSILSLSQNCYFLKMLMTAISMTMISRMFSSN